MQIWWLPLAVLLVAAGTFDLATLGAPSWRLSRETGVGLGQGWLLLMSILALFVTLNLKDKAIFWGPTLHLPSAIVMRLGVGLAVASVAVLVGAAVAGISGRAGHTGRGPGIVAVFLAPLLVAAAVLGGLTIQSLALSGT